LTSQAWRCSASIAANIAEGCAAGEWRISPLPANRTGFGNQLDYQLLLARD
jgi:hypothetical protein